MKRICTLLLAAGLVLGAAGAAKAVEINAKGDWMFGFGAINANFVKKEDGKNRDTSDKFAAVQRVRLQMTAVASEALSGTVYFEIGNTQWGQSGSGGALGADGKIVKLKRAYIDWTVPNTDLKFRMGMQGTSLPSAAGGSSIWDNDGAAIVGSYKFNDMVSLTAMWARPYNDNFGGTDLDHQNGDYAPANYLDNTDLFALMLPITGDGFKVTPWVMLGMAGQNVRALGSASSYYDYGTRPFEFMSRMAGFGEGYTSNAIRDLNFNKSSNPYGAMFWAGLPVVFNLDPWNFEFDFNYGYVESQGRYDAVSARDGAVKRANTQRSGWLAKALIEYKMDWGTPGLFGWYASGDDSNVKNGSERLPTIDPAGAFTSFIGDGTRGWSVGSGFDLALNYAGTWGVGVQLKDMSFLEDLKHTLRVAYWAGTNSPSMAKYLGKTDATNYAGYSPEGFYLTTNDSLVEINLDNSYQIYENLNATLELGYIVNNIDKGTWNRSYRTGSFQKQDGYKAALIFNYSF